MAKRFVHDAPRRASPPRQHCGSCSSRRRANPYPATRRRYSAYGHAAAASQPGPGVSEPLATAT
eukprot:395819-Hanusia_phi.AAC.1